MSSSQSTNRIIMVRPACFCFNRETASSNPFQNGEYADLSSPDKLHSQALIEFDDMVEGLRSHGVHVDVFEDTPIPVKPDAIFSDNWLTTHSDGTIFVYPMFAKNRRPERRSDLIEKLCENYKVTGIVDLSVNEHRNEYLEGTGSLIFDRINKIVYAARSPRTHERLIKYFTKLIHYQQPPIIFDCVDDKQNVIFHTNVVMSIATHVAIICLQAISDKNQRDCIVKSLELDGKRRIIDITFEQMKNFAGNMIEIQNKQGEYLLVMSKRAYQSLTHQQRNTIKNTKTKLIYFDVSTIEQCGGGSARCIITENFLHKNI